MAAKEGLETVEREAEGREKETAVGEESAKAEESVVEKTEEGEEVETAEAESGEGKVEGAGVEENYQLS